MNYSSKAWVIQPLPMPLVSTKRQRRSASPASNAAGNRLIRQWARDNGYQVSVRGQIAGDIIRAFEEANPGQ